MKTANDRQNEREIITRFIEVYCRKQHGGKHRSLCVSCQDLLDYAMKRLEKCPYDPKPKCKHCQTHCYRGDYRDKIREVMRFSGIHYVKRGRLDWLIKYFMR
ncbi:MAG: nitrous oxide-stimulated promoter family protein [Planctomycetes bacterium]|nr:nitrous oxide-stimulated promoter family protein [Planctomycetota bacterium]